VDQRRRLHLALRIGHCSTPEVAAALFPNRNSVYCITDMQAAQQRNFLGGVLSVRSACTGEVQDKYSWHIAIVAEALLRQAIRKVIIIALG
jgi:hypothetical protein